MEVKEAICGVIRKEDFAAAAVKIGPTVADMLAGKPGPPVPFKFSEADAAVTMLGQMCLMLIGMNQISEEKISFGDDRNAESVVRNYIRTGRWAGCWCVNCAGLWIKAMTEFTVALLEEIHGDTEKAAAAWESLMGGVFAVSRMLGARSIPAR